ncbi:MAG: hypothetical protein WCP69_15305 [Bacteroidota bacterium]
MRKNVFLLAFIIIGFLSCEGPKYFSITVVDKLTKSPIDSVFVEVTVKAGNTIKNAYRLSGFTDTTGKFIVSEMIGYGLSIRRWDFYMSYKKNGYILKTEKNHTEGEVELERIK